MHVHAPVSVAVGTVVDELPVIHYQQLLLGGEVRVARYSTFGSSDLADDVSAALTDRRAALMANHGSVAVAGTVAEALEHALLLEIFTSEGVGTMVVPSPQSTAQEASA